MKSGFSRTYLKTETLSAVGQSAGERGIWQCHFWKSLICDELNFQRFLDDAHVTPLKHGVVNGVSAGPYLTFHRAVAAGIYPITWRGDVDAQVDGDRAARVR